MVADRYELDEPVGAGGSAKVFRARDRSLGREVAVKLFAPGTAGAERARQQRELQLLARMHHPNLVELFDAGEFDGRAYLVMRLVDGPSLAERLAEGSLATDVAVALGAELAAALDYVHAQGVTHRDVKPANVLLGVRPMLSDFGISLLVDSTRITNSGYMIGTATYMAPEQVRGGTIGPPADVYALGLVLLETLTGHPAYDGPPAEAAIARLSQRPTIPADLPSGLGGLIDRMTADDPSLRPKAAVVADQLYDLATELHGGPLAVPAFLDTHQYTRHAAASPVPPSHTGPNVGGSPAGFAGMAAAGGLAGGLVGGAGAGVSTGERHVPTGRGPAAPGAPPPVSSPAGVRPGTTSPSVPTPRVPPGPPPARRPSTQARPALAPAVPMAPVVPVQQRPRHSITRFAAVAALLAVAVVGGLLALRLLSPAAPSPSPATAPLSPTTAAGAPPASAQPPAARSTGRSSGSTGDGGSIGNGGSAGSGGRGNGAAAPGSGPQGQAPAGGAATRAPGGAATKAPAAAETKPKETKAPKTENDDN